jgi:hypothetical protein
LNRRNNVYFLKLIFKALLQIELRRKQEDRILAHRQELKELFKVVLENKEKKDMEKLTKRQTNQRIKYEMLSTMKQLREMKDKQVKEEGQLVKEQKKFNEDMVRQFKNEVISTKRARLPEIKEQRQFLKKQKEFINV